MSDLGFPEDHDLLLALFSAEDFPNLNDSQVKDALALLNEFANLFISSPSVFGLAKGVIHQIATGDAPPFKETPYCCSQVKDAAISKELKKLLEAGLLAPSQNPWASPLLTPKKRDGGN